MSRFLAWAGAVTLLLSAGAASAQTQDPIGDLIGRVAARVQPMMRPILATFGLKVSLYHGGSRGIRSKDSLGCKVIPMRTAAVDGVDLPRHSLLFIKETVGMPMPGGGVHDGYWYASDIGGGIHRGRIDLFTGEGSGSMAPLMRLNMTTLTVAKVGEFEGCPKN